MRSVRALARSVSVWRDAWSIVRSFGRAKGFAAAAMFTVAIGIGVNTVVFSLFDRLLFRPLPYVEPDRLVQIHSGADPVWGHPILPTAVALGLARETNLFSGIGWAYGGDLTPMAPVAGENPLLWLTGVTTNTLDVLGIRPVIGAGMSALPATTLERPVLLTYDVWQRRYGASDDVLSLAWTARDAAERDVHWRVVGVLPKGFLLPSPRLTTAEFDGIYGVDPGFDRRLSLTVVGVAPFARLAPGVSATVARARVNAFVASAFGRLRNPYTFAEARVSVVSLHSGQATLARSYAWLAVLGAWAVLGATCLTLAVLLLTWSQSRRQDAGVRLALGASPARLVVGALAESSLLCGVGAVIGWMAYTWARSLFVSALPLGLQAYASETADARVIAATCGIALVSALVAGTLPAIRTSRTSPLDVLRPEQGTMGFDRLLGGPFLLAAQAALGLVLLVGAAAILPGVLRALWQPPGFEAGDLYFVPVPTANDRTAADAREQVRRGREALNVARGLPGVVGASLSLKDPLWPSPIEAQRLQNPAPNRYPGRVLPVDGEFFATAGTPLLAGRTFSAAEIEQQALVAIVNETGAEALAPGSSVHDVLGRTVTTEDGPRVIVGIAADFRVGMDAQRIPALFLPLSANEAYRHLRDNPYPWNEYGLVLRMADGRVPDVTLLSDRLRELPWALPRWLGARRESVAAKLGVDLATPRLLALIFGTLGAIALLLSVIAIYGLANFEIRRRREEMTIRLALGATPHSLRRRLAAVTSGPIVAGMLAGLPVSWIEARLLSRSVPAVNAGDPWIYVAAATMLLVAALAAAWMPGRRSFTMRAAELLRPS